MVNLSAGRSSMSHEPTVFIVDDDEAARNAIAALVQSMDDFRLELFASAQAFMAQVGPQRPGCLIIDLSMTGMDGLSWQQRLAELGYVLPLIVVSSPTTTAAAVQAMRQGALTVLDKPFDAEQLKAAIHQALDLDARRRAALQQRQDLQARLDLLTDAEQQVMQRMLEGKANKAIAEELDVSLRTVESRRRQIFQKTQTDSVAALVQLVMQAREPLP
jgi:FixJ family two-component response regulator